MPKLLDSIVTGIIKLFYNIKSFKYKKYVPDFSDTKFLLFKSLYYKIEKKNIFELFKYKKIYLYLFNDYLAQDINK